MYYVCKVKKKRKGKKKGNRDRDGGLEENTNSRVSPCQSTRLDQFFLFYPTNRIISV